MNYWRWWLRNQWLIVPIAVAASIAIVTGMAAESQESGMRPREIQVQQYQTQERILQELVKIRQLLEGTKP